MQRTLSIIKPDATKRNLCGAILHMIEQQGLRIIATKMVYLTKNQAEAFYAVHKGKPFFDKLVDYMCSGPILCSVLEAENAIEKYRKIMGATNFEQAEEGTIRKTYAVDVTQNSVHGSDAPETAVQEIAFFFNSFEVIQ